MTVEPFTNPVMTREDVLRVTPRAQRAVCLLLLEHGINPGAIPADRYDAFTETGYIVVTGIDRDAGRFITERRRWPDGLTLQQIDDAYETDG